MGIIKMEKPVLEIFQEIETQIYLYFCGQSSLGLF